MRIQHKKKSLLPVIVKHNLSSIQQLRLRGLKVTKQRMAVMRVLEYTQKPMSVEKIEKKISNIDRVTIYRILELFLHKGLVRRVDLRHAHAHYDLVITDDHHYISCTSCGDIERVPICQEKLLIGIALKHSQKFSNITDHNFEFFGRCIKCSNV